MTVRNCLVIVGSRNQRAAVNWPAIALCAGLVAVMVAAGYCGAWYLLTSRLPDLTPVVGAAFFVTVTFMGGALRKGLTTPVAELRPLDR
jgi:hypothetical protein